MSEMSRNPFFKKITFTSSGAVASYQGIAVKSAILWVLCFVGMGLFRLLPGSVPMAVALLASAAVVLICPLLIYLLPGVAKVMAPVYAVAQGLLLAVVCQEYAGQYAGYIWIAIGLTAVVFLVMLILYRSGIVKADARFRTITMALFMSLMASGIIMLISRLFTTALTDLFLNNPLISTIVAVVCLVISVMRLVYEFDYVQRIVGQGAERKYEWVAAFGLFITVIMIFLRILELVSSGTRDKD